MAKTPSPKRRYGDGRVEFLALLEPITEAVERGHTLRSIFDKHLGKSGMSYAQFARYVARYVRKDDKPNPQPASQWALLRRRLRARYISDWSVVLKSPPTISGSATSETA